MRKVLLVIVLLTSILFASSDYSTKRIKLSGNIADHIKPRVTIKELEKDGLDSFIIQDPYLKKDMKYSGISLDKLVSLYGKKTVTSLKITAIDGYKVVFNKKEWDNDTILLATRVNDEYYGFDKKGPLRVIYPNYDEKLPKYHKNLTKWIWMIKTIEFK